MLVMVQGHVMDAWTTADDRARAAYQWISFVGGLGGAPIFLFLAGVALALAAGARMRRGRSAREVAALARRRGWQIFGLAFLFRLQSWVISGGSPWALLKVDILNVMGLAMLGGALLWSAGRSRSSRALLLTSAAVATAMPAPLVRASAWVALLPDPVEAYLRPVSSMAAFTLLPWAGSSSRARPSASGSMPPAPRTRSSASISRWPSLAPPSRLAATRRRCCRRSSQRRTSGPARRRSSSCGSGCRRRSWRSPTPGTGWAADPGSASSAARRSSSSGSTWRWRTASSA
ncbi:MAG: DUF1624 domain-containing protein [Acidimicrobiia bacterium]|nr:DUF1624 domain-containing protein [Acidimicrobiia bacterium]